jgi:hypothetical protein
MLKIEPLVVEKSFRRLGECELRRRPTVLMVIVSKEDSASPICEYLMYVARFMACHLRYVIFVDTFGSFLAMIPVANFSRNAKLITPTGECTADRLIKWVADKDESIHGIEGFVWERDGAKFDWSRRQCLEVMEALHVDALPWYRMDCWRPKRQSSRLKRLSVR